VASRSIRTPNFPGKSALEVILTTLHSGGKFSDKAYSTSGGLHGVGVSVVNALSVDTTVEVARNRELFRQRFSKGHPQGALEKIGAAPNRRGTSVTFVPDAEIFRRAALQADATLQAGALQGLSVRGRRDTLALRSFAHHRRYTRRGGVPVSRRPCRSSRRAGRPAQCATKDFFAGTQEFAGATGRAEWAVAWPLWSDGSYSWYCNTIPTPMAARTRRASARLW
jgi:topoisomerase-4 subunit B